MYELTIETDFSSAHNLRGYEGSCENLHGHNWRVKVSVAAGQLDSLGMVVDFKKLKAASKAVIERLDHAYLNEVAPFDKENPTAENIARHIYLSLAATINDGNIAVSKVQVWESATSSAAYRESHED